MSTPNDHSDTYSDAIFVEFTFDAGGGVGQPDVTSFDGPTYFFHDSDDDEPDEPTIVPKP